MKLLKGLFLLPLLLVLNGCKEPPVEEIKELYNKRWGIETSFRELKYAVAMNGIDYIVFTGGVGENQINVRKRYVFIKHCRNKCKCL